MGQGLTGKALGIFGMGRIGRGVATLAKAFGMSIHTYDPRKKDNRNADIATVHEELNSFLSTIDVLMLASPLNDETRFFFSKDKIDRMKRSAIVVNVGRGDLVNDDDLIDALRNQRPICCRPRCFQQRAEARSAISGSSQRVHAATHRKLDHRNARDDGASLDQRVCRICLPDANP